MTGLLSTMTLALAPEAAHGAASAAAPAHALAAVGPSWALLIPGLPLLGFLVMGLYAVLGVRSKAPAWSTVIGLAASFGFTVALYFHWQRAGGGAMTIHAWDWFDIQSPGASFLAGFSFYVDSLTIYWMLFVTGLATLIALYASEYMSHDVGLGYCRFFAAFNLFVFSMACLVMGANLVMLYLGWEGVGLCSYLLIGYFYKKPSAVAAAKKAFIVNRIGDLGLALGLYLTFVHFGTVEYAQLFNSEKLAGYLQDAMAGDFSAIPAQAQWIALLLMVGAFGKSAQFPLYVWLPDAMEGPTPVSALIHAATMVTAGVYLVARFYPVFLVSEWALPIVAWIGAITALLAATIGMAQFDIKRIMAYSTVSQLGYMFAGLGVLTPTGGAYHVLTHAFFKALLFLACGAVMHGFAGQLDLRRLSGLGKLKGWGVVTLGMFVGCINLAGVPFTAGYFSKDTIIAECFVTPGASAIGWVLLVTAGLTAYYTFRVFFRVFMGPLEFHPGDEHHDPEPLMAEEEHFAEEGEDQGQIGHPAHRHAEVHGHDQAGHPAHGSASRATSEHRSETGATHFHPHAPGWAINTVLIVLTVCSLAATGLYFFGGRDVTLHGHTVHTKHYAAAMVQQSTAAFVTPYDHHAFEHAGHVEAGEHGSSAAGVGPRGTIAKDKLFFGYDPHKAMYWVSGAVGAMGILFAAALHWVGRKDAAHCGMDAIARKFGPIPYWAERKWFVDEFYDAAFRRPLLALSTFVLATFDRWIVDGLVNAVGFAPRILGAVVRPTQSGRLHGYAGGMVFGLVVVLLIAVLVMVRTGGLS